MPVLASDTDKINWYCGWQIQAAKTFTDTTLDRVAAHGNANPFGGDDA